ncbi:hypothetical protein OsI_02140 [Oryza sativa Indica Group]|uniref:Uncharacterized protein n=1 Tax=Oryza sativa subsp. indica TaxID=39946 RepID=B8A8W5_ORYSI|nr:hypothetical protein OsI_02140 [Oryza sativa Indica Group]
MAGRRAEERLTTRRGDGRDGRSGAAAAGSGLPAVGSGASMTDLAGASPRATTMGAEGGGGGWRLAAAGEGGRHVCRTQWRWRGHGGGGCGGWRAGRHSWRPALVEAVDGDAAGSYGGRRAREAAVAATAEAWPMMAQGDVAQPATGDGCTARRSGRGRW